jgi:tRNA pseudouridine55 synthase
MPSFHGLLVLDKPGGITSREAVDGALRWFPRGTRVGHTGTLDPLATGVLALCVGVATRLTEYVQRMDKTYRAGLRLGARSDTDDADGTIEPVAGPIPDSATVAARLGEMIGEIDQVPPTYSAAKVSGRRAYDLARQGREVDLQPRRVRIYGIDVLSYEYPRLELEVLCGKGTYIRSLARDLGERLGCGALIETLRRTRVGPFRDVDGIDPAADAALASSRLLPVSAAVSELPRVTLSPPDVARLRQGQSVPLSPTALPDAPGEGRSEWAVFAGDNILVGVAVLDPVRRLLKPDKVLTV